MYAYIPSSIRLRRSRVARGQSERASHQLSLRDLKLKEVSEYIYDLSSRPIEQKRKSKESAHGDWPRTKHNAAPDFNGQA